VTERERQTERHAHTERERERERERESCRLGEQHFVESNSNRHRTMALIASKPITITFE
jgi:hypothetical protein